MQVVQNSKVKVTLPNNGFKTRSKISNVAAPVKRDFIGQSPDY
jgi:hypothetical protein